MESPTIRPALPEDHEAIVDCVQMAYSKYVERIGKKPAPMLADYASLIAQNIVHVLTIQDKVVGVLVVVPRDSYLFIDNVAVQPPYQGQGLGRTLMAFAETTAKELKLGAIRLYTNERMTENLAFYAKLGYVETDRRENEGYRRVFMVKNL